MILSQKTLDSLREMINEKTMYRKGSELVRFFNQLGFNERYGNGFPSRWVYTDDKLSVINGRPELDKCIKMVFNPAEFIGRMNELKACLDEFNEYLAFDGWKVEVKNTGVEIHRVTGPDVEAQLKESYEAENIMSEADFLKVEIEDINISQLSIDETLKPVLDARMTEIKSCFKAQAYLSGRDRFSVTRVCSVGERDKRTYLEEILVKDGDGE